MHAGGMVSLFHMFILHRLLTCLLALPPEDVLPVVYLCTHKVASDYENIITPRVLISYKVMDSYSTFLKDKVSLRFYYCRSLTKKVTDSRDTAANTKTRGTHAVLMIQELTNGGCLITSALEEACGGQTGEK
ncbi:hypothetical protein J1N35_021597 [Gossypium stocksii]|uniref:Secreted protein n=1 Tax=Gossypium stocksii TaxID=47602 RepID=A0A9D3VET6_9ROSI|nr:hypothetical protein J1N35_021597 [Gossypium stocksii]